MSDSSGVASRFVDEIVDGTVVPAQFSSMMPKLAKKAHISRTAFVNQAASLLQARGRWITAQLVRHHGR